MHTPREVISFWFGTPATDFESLKAKMRRWFMGPPDFDALIVREFRPEVEAAITGGLEDWLAAEKGWLALILVLDQLTRNVFRNDARTHAGDARAQALAIAALDNGATRALPHEERHFAIMPLVHAEDTKLQARHLDEINALIAATPESLRPIYAMGLEQGQKYSDIIARFGRFPHRNAILGRTSTPEEEAFLVDWEKKRAPAAMR